VRAIEAAMQQIAIEMRIAKISSSDIFASLIA
jgi:hypothetical protein